MSGNALDKPRNDDKRQRGVDDPAYEMNVNNNSPDPLLTEPVDRPDAYYKMNHRKRGLAIIFNHEIFEIPKFKKRNGTNVDCDNLGNVLKGLGFEVRPYQNSIFDRIKEILKDVADMDHTDHDCLVIAVMTHGDMGYFAAHDKEYETDTIWSYFTPDRCPTLADKPKMIIIQACQGNKTDAGTDLKYRTECDGGSDTTPLDPPKNRRSRVPPMCDVIIPDFLIAFATIPDYYSWRNSIDGSWFIQTLCKELRKNGTNYDILTLLTIVSQKVALNFESYAPEEPEMHKRKQIPCTTSTLKRLLKFTPPTNDPIAVEGAEAPKK